jgi:hypothetical protein
MPSTMSMSAAGWTRIQRQKAGLNYGPMVMNTSGAAPTNRDINPTPANQQPYGTALLIPANVGGSRIRRTASDYTNYVAGRFTDYYFKSQGSGRVGETGDNNAYTRFRITRLCNCTTTTMDSKTGLCASCLKR